MKTVCSRKSVASVLTAIIVLIVFPSALTENLAFDQYKNEDLIELLLEVQAEVVSRGIEKTATLEAGQYVGGKDIPVGSYVLICKTDADHHGIVWLSAANDNLDTDYPSKLFDHIGFNKESSYYIHIEDGDILHVPFSVQLRISAGVVFR